MALLLVLLVPFTSLAGCGGSENAETADIVTTSPWVGIETVTYRLRDANGRPQGQAVLAVQRDGDKLRLTQTFTSDSNRDETSVLVDPQTLKPASGTRTITGDSQDEITTTYTEDGVLIRQGGKQSGLTVPEHSYDNDTSLFLWRTIRFEEGYTASYNTIITNRRNRQVVTLRLVGKESLQVPAGQFSAWRLEIKAGDVKQTAWIADTRERTLLKYDNSRNLIFELEKLP